MTIRCSPARAVAWATSRRRRTVGGPASTRRTAQRRSNTSRPCETRGARYLVVPSTQFWWLHHYGEMTAHLNSAYRRIYSDDHLVMFDLDPEQRPAIRYRGPAGRPRAGARHRLLRSRAQRAAGAAPRGARTARSNSKCNSIGGRVEPPGRSAGEDGEADWILHVDAAAVLPTRFVDEFFGIVSSLSALGVERAQPAHICRPDAGPPVTARVRGVLGREVARHDPAPGDRRAVRRRPRGSHRAGGRRSDRAVPSRSARARIQVAYSDVSGGLPRRRGSTGPRWCARSNGGDPPRISVLIATYERPALLAECLEGFCEQTIPASEFEVVVVDDGSADPETQRRARRLRVATAAHVDPHRALRPQRGEEPCRAPRAGDLVLFFDDDDRPAADLLDEHIQAHASHPGEATAILGHTDWDPRLEVSQLMHYLTDVDRLLFAYPNFEPGQRLDWQGFWEGRVSSKRALHLRHGLHDQRLEYSIDVELAWRLRRPGPRSRLPPRRPQRDAAADRLRRVLPPLRGEGPRPGRHRIAPRPPGDARVHEGRGRRGALEGGALGAAAADGPDPRARA